MSGFRGSWWSFGGCPSLGAFEDSIRGGMLGALGIEDYADVCIVWGGNADVCWVLDFRCVFRVSAVVFFGGLWGWLVAR